MEYFNIISGVASIASLGLSVWALRRVHTIEAHFGLTTKANTKISQKAVGRDIQQAGGDIHG
jgi:hypothetical protein